jgi:hypothetical protein
MAEAKKLSAGMYNVVFVKDFGSYKKDEKAIYHSSTAETLSAKGIIKVGTKIKEYVPKAAKK